MNRPRQPECAGGVHRATTEAPLYLVARTLQALGEEPVDEAHIEEIVGGLVPLPFPHDPSPAIGSAAHQRDLAFDQAEGEGRR